jgi:uncharacterized protein
MVVDFHTHIFPPRIIERRDYYCNNDRFLAMLYSDPKSKMVTTEQLLESMDQNEVEMSVVLNISWENQDLCILTNDYIMESISR